MRTKSSGWIITCNSNNNWTEAKPCAEGFSLKVQSPTMQWKEITRLCQCEKCCPSATFFSTCPITNHTNKTIWYRLLLILRHPDNIMDIPWSKHGWLYPGPAPLILPPNYHKCAPGLGFSSQAFPHPVMKSKGLRRGQLSSPFSLLLRENVTLDRQNRMMDDQHLAIILIASGALSQSL